MMRRVTLLVAVGVAVLLALAGCGATGTSEEANSPSATSPPKTPATLITRATLGEVKAENDAIKVESGPGSADVALVKVVLKPGGSTGWHHHPAGVGLASVASGIVTFYHEDCHQIVYKAGEGFLESLNEPMVVRNEGEGDAVFYVTFIIPTNTPPDGLTIADPQPENCDVK